jgi:hypothetical protein
MGSKCSCTDQYTALFRPFAPCLDSSRDFFNSLLDDPLQFRQGITEALKQLEAVFVVKEARAC